MTRHKWKAAVLAGALFAFHAAGAFALDGITVQGSGEASGRPTRIEIPAILICEAELATDVTVKFRDARKRAVGAIENLKIPGLSVNSDGVTVSTPMDANAQMMMMRGQTVNQVNQKVQVLEADRIVLANTDKLTPQVLLDTVLKLLDAAKDAGLQVGPKPPSTYYEMQTRGNSTGNAVVIFRRDDDGTLRDQAYKAAIEDAKNKAQKLADLAGVKLGHVVSVTEQGASGVNSELAMIIRMNTGENPAAQSTSLTGASSADLKLHVNLVVQFEILK